MKKKAPLIDKSSKSHSPDVEEALSIIQQLEKKHFAELLPVTLEQDASIFDIVHHSFIKLGKVSYGIFTKDTRGAKINLSFAENGIIEALVELSGTPFNPDAYAAQRERFKNILAHPEEHVKEIAEIRAMKKEKVPMKDGQRDIPMGEIMLDSYEALKKLRPIVERMPEPKKQLF